MDDAISWKQEKSWWQGERQLAAKLFFLCQSFFLGGQWSHIQTGWGGTGDIGMKITNIIIITTTTNSTTNIIKVLMDSMNFDQFLSTLNVLPIHNIYQNESTCKQR
eukprot:954190_1